MKRSTPWIHTFLGKPESPPWAVPLLGPPEALAFGPSVRQSSLHSLGDQPALKRLFMQPQRRVEFQSVRWVLSVGCEPPQPRALSGKTSKRSFFLSLTSRAVILPFPSSRPRCCSCSRDWEQLEQIAVNRPFHGERCLTLFKPILLVKPQSLADQ